MAPARLTPALTTRPSPPRTPQSDGTYRRALLRFLKLADLAIVTAAFVLVSRMVLGRKLNVCGQQGTHGVR